MINSANAKLLLALIICALVALVVLATPPVGAQVTPGITVSAMNLDVLEQGTGTFTVRLATQPAADVEVSLTSRNTDDATVSESSLTFTTSSWNSPQTVTGAGVDDDPNAETEAERNRAHQNRTVRIDLETTSTDPDYGAKTKIVTVTVITRETFIDRLNPNGTTNDSTIVAGFFSAQGQLLARRFWSDPG